MAKFHFSLLRGDKNPKGQQRKLGPGYQAVFRAYLESHLFPQDSAEPIPVWVVRAQIHEDSGEHGWIIEHDGLGVVFPESFPTIGKMREKLLRHLNDAYDAANDDVEPLDEWWINEGKKNWPPPRNEWKVKQ